MKAFRVFLFLLIFLSACTSANPAALTNATPTNKPQTSAGNSAYPAQEDASSTKAYPAPAVQSAVEPTPTRDPGKAMVSGRLLVSGKPVNQGIIYLSEILKGQDGKELVVSLDRESKLRGDIDSAGNFTIYNVPAGRYGVVYDLVSQAYLLMAPHKDESFIIDVAAGKDLKLGDLDYPMLPANQ